jgi:hypothetical protein
MLGVHTCPHVQMHMHKGKLPHTTHLSPGKWDVTSATPFYGYLIGCEDNTLLQPRCGASAVAVALGSIYHHLCIPYHMVILSSRITQRLSDLQHRVSLRHVEFPVGCPTDNYTFRLASTHAEAGEPRNSIPVGDRRPGYIREQQPVTKPNRKTRKRMARDEEWTVNSDIYIGEPRYMCRHRCPYRSCKGVANVEKATLCDFIRPDPRVSLAFIVMIINGKEVGSRRQEQRISVSLRGYRRSNHR